MEATATVANPNPSDSPARLIEATGLLQDIRRSVDERYAPEPEATETEEEDEEREERPWLGMGVALATFVPTFLSIVLGLPLLLATVSTPAGGGPAQTQVAGPQSPTALDRPVGDAWDPADVVGPRPDGVPMKSLKLAATDVVTWTRAAALADERAAVRLAASLRSQGFRVDLRREDDSTLPWVLWTTKGPTRRSPK